MAHYASNSSLSCQNPRSAQAICIARTIRAENGIPFHTFEIESEEPGFGSLVLRVFIKIQATDDTESLTRDKENADCNGMVYVGRYHSLSMQESQNNFVNNEAHEVRTLEIDKFNYLQGEPPLDAGFSYRTSTRPSCGRELVSQRYSDKVGLQTCCTLRQICQQ